MKKLKFITFSDGCFSNKSAERFMKEIYASGIFSDSERFTLNSMNDIGLLRPSVRDFIDKNAKGVGF